MEERELRAAKKFGILDKCQELEQELLQIGRVKKIEFDLDEFYSNIYQVIILATYDIPVTLENYFEARKEVVNNIVNVAGTYGLTRTEDRIEDYFILSFVVLRNFLMKNNNGKCLEEEDLSKIFPDFEY